MENQCDMPRCRNWAEIGYIGKGLCWKHWEQICLAEGKTAKGLLKRIGLARDDSGAVVVIKRKRKEDES